jgi:hypothetical protein
MNESDGVSGFYCMVGGPPCADGNPTTSTACTPSRYCAPDDLCEGSICGTGPNGWECAKDPLQSPNTPLGSYEHIECDLAAVRDPNGALVLCPNTGKLPINDGSLPTTIMCTRVAIRSTTHGFQDTLEVGTTAGYKVSIDAACSLTVAPNGTYATPPGGFADPAGGLLAIDFQTAHRNVVYPIQFNVFPIASTTGCEEMRCYHKNPVSQRLKACVQGEH